jgi:surface protein
MFHSATNFNQDISNWKTYNVISMNSMFYDQNISTWDMTKVIGCLDMFSGATKFKGNVNKIRNIFTIFYQRN